MTTPPNYNPNRINNPYIFNKRIQKVTIPIYLAKLSIIFHSISHGVPFPVTKPAIWGRAWVPADTVWRSLPPICPDTSPKDFNHLGVEPTQLKKHMRTSSNWILSPKKFGVKNKKIFTKNNSQQEIIYPLSETRVGQILMIKLSRS